MISGSRRTLLLLFTITVLVRLLFSWVAVPILAHYGITADNWPDSYNLFSLNLIRGHGFAIEEGVPSIMRGPVYPLLGAFSFVVFGSENLAGIQFIHALLDGC